METLYGYAGIIKKKKRTKTAFYQCHFLHSELQDGYCWISRPGRNRQELLVLTVVHQEAKFLNHRQVPRHSVDAVSLQACKPTRHTTVAAFIHRFDSTADLTPPRGSDSRSIADTAPPAGLGWYQFTLLLSEGSRKGMFNVGM